ncbi:D-alanine--D-alanine ligase [Candidatus Saccharibacteria bacterium]|nr:MAG: D-alanine--D-alanine ligase [Candidatus Saccharibacteria bacterium]
MNTVCVICGGTSDERDVSLRSGAAVAEALKSVGHDVDVYDVDVKDNTLQRFDVVFPVLHGKGGEDGVIQKRLETAGVCFVGTGSTASALCMDKTRYREAMIAAGIKMPAGVVVTAASFAASPLSQRPYVLKPVNGGSTIDTLIVHSPPHNDTAALAEVFAKHTNLLLEELITGTEITVGVFGGDALPVIEIIPPEGADFDYANKYNGKTQELCPPQHVSTEQQQAAQALALQVHALAGCRDMSRTDFIIDESGVIYLLETNTIPGMTAQSLYPKMAAAAGIDFPSLCDRLVHMALSRR